MKNKSSSGISIAFRKILESFENQITSDENQTPSEFIIKMANTLEERASVFHLGHQIYFKKGYLKENENGWLIQNYDADSETAILIV